MGFTVPSFGDFDPVQILRNDPDSFRIRFHQNMLNEDEPFDLADLIPSTFDGTEQAEIVNPGWNLPDQIEDGRGEILSVTNTLEMADDMPAQDVAGYTIWYLDGVTEHFIGFEQFDVPITLTVAGDSFSRAFRLAVAEFATS